MHLNPHIFRGYDLRGEVDKDLNPEIAEHLGRAYGTYLHQQGISRAVVGRDCRLTSPDYSAALTKGIAATGVAVVDIGLTLVGTFYWAQYYLEIQGGVMVTASHNPKEYNGFKFATNFSETMVAQELEQLRVLVEAEDYFLVKEPAKVTQQDVLPAYYQDLANRFSINKKFTVVVDPSHATPGAIVPELLRKVGCEVVEKNTSLDGTFPLGVADPTETTVANRLVTEVLEAKADIGFSYDADGDRIGIVDETGGIIWNDVLVALFAEDVLAQHPGATIMYNTLCSKVVDDTIKANGGKPYMWRTGHSFLKRKNQEVGAAFIGELSGHFFFSADFYNHDDGCYTTLRVLDYLSRTKQTLSQAVGRLPKYISSPEVKVGCPDDQKALLIKKLGKVLRTDWPEAEVIDDERAGDGVRLEMVDSMFVIRYSQNGPYLTIKFEAHHQEKYDALKKYINDLLHQYSEVDWSFGV
ncbi:phosphomannomutase/phosphoglucomutase, partial [Candidatus Falkowbacteria bacterium]|nr:phosphomannomutase/phosphoglucomutase [Candidatus Falkowbacteria bacterium]